VGESIQSALHSHYLDRISTRVAISMFAWAGLCRKGFLSARKVSLGAIRSRMKGMDVRVTKASGMPFGTQHSNT
jgi:hypothetical protein